MLLSGHLVLTPTDLSAFLSCRHRTALDLAVAHGALARPEWSDPLGQAMRDRGLEHERRYVERLRAAGLEVVDLTEIRDRDDAVAHDAATRAAMARGADVIVQALLNGHGWRGYADVLVRVDRASALGAWSYEVHDTKLARETRGGTILQLGVYSDLLTAMQGLAPAHFHVVMPAPDGDTTGLRVESFRLADYDAYVRRVRADLLATVARGHETLIPETYPEPSEACELCRWWERCNARRRADDHLGFVAGMSRTHAAEFTANQAPTLARAAALAHPLPFTPRRGSRETYEKLRDQARLQHAQRTSGQPVHELQPVEAGFGLARLPEPSTGDVFLDLEGAAFAREGGREYLFGLWLDGTYRSWWAIDDAQERAAFEAVMDLIEARWAGDPGMHVYHYAPYEPSAFKRLMGRYATRADLLDRLLRGERFVDLLAVTRQALRAGVESYSIKQLEPFYAFRRQVPLDQARAQMMAIELALESHAPHAIPDDTRQAVTGYNADDCRSTHALRDWLESLRAQVEASGTPVPRPEEKPPEAPKKVSDLETQQMAARERLLHGVPEQADARTPDQHARWLMAYLLDWHRREDKAQYWERYRLNDLPDDELFDERNAIAGLEFVETVGTAPGRKKGSLKRIDRYRYPQQDTEIRDKGELLVAGKPTKIGDIEAHDRIARTLDIRKMEAMTEVDPSAVFASTVVSTDQQQKALLRLAERVDDVSCGMDLLHRRPPRLTSGTLAPLVYETPIDHARRLALALDRTTLAVQGPPGSGKTYIGAQMIRALVAAGKRVGVVATSHKVIVHLLDAVTEQARAAGETVRIGRKGGQDDAPDETEAAAIAIYEENEDALAAIATRQIAVLGGTAWMWARDEFQPGGSDDHRPARGPAVDVLVVDEAGQFSLANALAVSSAATSLVLLGDPQQLQQPQKGSHPDGVDVSALQHVLGAVDTQTMPADRGLFLSVTWRLAPAICGFTSEQFYEGRLDAREELHLQALTGTDGLDGSGLSWIPVEHSANRHWSAEEIDAVDELITRLLTPGAQWTTGDGVAKPLTPADILVVAPYNAHVNRLADRLAPRGIRVGTVDKFQGQEAPVVIYAMAASTPQDAPRGMEFLYSRHRLNVATSRARCRAFVVASPALLAPDCRTPRQMRLANALCRFVELANR